MISGKPLWEAPIERTTEHTLSDYAKRIVDFETKVSKIIPKKEDARESSVSSFTEETSFYTNSPSY
jgi:hypothetical protein